MFWFDAGGKNCLFLYSDSGWSVCLFFIDYFYNDSGFFLTEEFGWEHSLKCLKYVFFWFGKHPFLACTVKVCCLVVVRHKNHRGSEHLWLRGWQCEKCGGEPPGRNTHTHIQAVCSHLQWLCSQHIDWWMKLLFFQCYNDQSIRMMSFVLSCHNHSLWTLYILFCHWYTCVTPSLLLVFERSLIYLPFFYFFRWMQFNPPHMTN